MMGKSNIFSEKNRGPLLALAPLLIMLLVLFVWPIAGIFESSFGEDVFTLTSYQRAIGSEVYRQIFYNTLEIAAVVTIGAIIVSYPFAYVMATVSPSMVKLLTFVVLLPFWTSALVRTTAWVILLQRRGVVNVGLEKVGFIDEPISFLYNFSGVLIGMIHVLMPFMVLPLYGAFRSIDGRLLQAAKGLGAGPWRGFIRIILPLSAPGVAAGGLIVFMTSIGYYITPSLMGGPKETMISQQIAYHMQEQLDWGMASALAVILLITTLSIFAIFQKYFGFDKMFSGQDTGEPLRQGDEKSNIQRLVFNISATLAAIFLIAPILVILPMSISESPFIKFPPNAFTFEWFENLYYDPRWSRAFFTSLEIAVMAVVISLFLGTSAAIGLSRLKSRMKPIIEAFVMTPLIIPPIIIAVGLYSFYAPLEMLGSSLGLAIGHALLATPFVFIAVRASLRSFDQNIELAAIGLGANRFTMFRRIMLPSIWPGLMAGSIFAFITSFDDVILAIFLTDVRSRTLPRVIYEGVKYDTDPTIVALAAILIFVSMVVLITNLILERRK
jgi:putative spermidine/putrescine transport system permease protein